MYGGVVSALFPWREELELVEGSSEDDGKYKRVNNGKHETVKKEVMLVASSQRIVVMRRSSERTEQFDVPISGARKRTQSALLMTASRER